MEYDDLLSFTKKLDRSLFLENELKQYADVDKPLPIGHGQTISQPSLVNYMTYLLNPEKNTKVLEIGTGSGYQTVLLAEFSKIVYTVERIGELSEIARKRHNSMGYTNIIYRVGDGSKGWEENAPYDRIIVTAAAGEIPKEMLQQLKAGGRMVIPVGPKGLQELKVITKDEEGAVMIKNIEAVRFVELKGDYGW